MGTYTDANDRPMEAIEAGMDAERDRQERPHREPGPKCSECGGRETWCAQCLRYSRTCCVEYGTCQCS